MRNKEHQNYDSEINKMVEIKMNGSVTIKTITQAHELYLLIQLSDQKATLILITL